jgi:hypothetical protein
VGAVASAATMGVGSLAKRAVGNAVEREAQMADAIARNGGALDMPPLLDEETKRALRAVLAGQGTQYIPR